MLNGVTNRVVSRAQHNKCTLFNAPFNDGLNKDNDDKPHCRLK